MNGKTFPELGDSMSTILEALICTDCVEAELYCRNEDCPLREVTVRIKDYEHDIDEDSEWSCPFCGEPLTTHHATSFVEKERSEVEDALWVLARELAYLHDRRDAVSLSEIAAHYDTLRAHIYANKQDVPRTDETPAS